MLEDKTENVKLPCCLLIKLNFFSLFFTARVIIEKHWMDCFCSAVLIIQRVWMYNADVCFEISDLPKYNHTYSHISLWYIVFASWCVEIKNVSLKIFLWHVLNFIGFIVILCSKTLFACCLKVSSKKCQFQSRILMSLIPWFGISYVQQQLNLIQLSMRYFSQNIWSQ